MDNFKFTVLLQTLTVSPELVTLDQFTDALQIMTNDQTALIQKALVSKTRTVETAHHIVQLHIIANSYT